MLAFCLLKKERGEGMPLASSTQQEYLRAICCQRQFSCVSPRLFSSWCCHWCETSDISCVCSHHVRNRLLPGRAKCVCKTPRSLPAVVLWPARPGTGGALEGNHVAQPPPSSSMCCVKRTKTKGVSSGRLADDVCCVTVADVSVCVASEYLCPSQWRGGNCHPPNGKWTPVSGGGDWSDDGLSWGCVPVLLFVSLLFSPTVSAVCLWLWVLWKRSLLACISLQQWGHKEHLYNAKAAQTCCHQQKWPIRLNLWHLNYFSCSKMRQSTLHSSFDYCGSKKLFLSVVLSCITELHHLNVGVFKEEAIEKNQLPSQLPSHSDKWKGLCRIWSLKWPSLNVCIYLLV